MLFFLWTRFKDGPQIPAIAHVIGPVSARSPDGPPARRFHTGPHSSKTSSTRPSFGAPAWPGQNAESVSSRRLTCGIGNIVNHGLHRCIARIQRPIAHRPDPPTGKSSTEGSLATLTFHNVVMRYKNKWALNPFELSKSRPGNAGVRSKFATSLSGRSSDARPNAKSVGTISKWSEHSVTRSPARARSVVEITSGTLNVSS